MKKVPEMYELSESDIRQAVVDWLKAKNIKIFEATDVKFLVSQDIIPLPTTVPKYGISPPILRNVVSALVKKPAPASE